MPMVTTKDGMEIFYKDWGSGQPIVFSHGWPLSADDWDAQMLFFLGQGLSASSPMTGAAMAARRQTGDGHDMDHYADDLAALTAHLDLKNAIHVGHSTGGGEVVHYIARHGESRVAKAALISAVPPLMVKTAANPGGLPKEVFDGLQAQLAANRAQFYYDLPAGPFYGFNRPGAKTSEPVIWNWWRQGMMGGAKAHYDGIVAFSQTDFTEDLKKITVPVLVMHGEDDQIVPYAARRPAVGEAAEERHPEDLQGLSARHDHHPGGDDQRRPAGLHQGLSGARRIIPKEREARRRWTRGRSPPRPSRRSARGGQIAPFSERYPGFALDDAYRVTAAVRARREARGERPIGRKIGFTNRTIWAEYGVYAPIWGYVYDRTVHDLARRGASFSLSGLAEPRIEPEIVFGLAAAPAPGMDARALIGCIEWVAHGFEIVQSIFPDWKFAAADTVAAYGLHGALLIGPRHRVGGARARLGARSRDV